MIIKKAQFNFVDVFDETMSGWTGHTRVQIKKIPGKPVRVYYVSGKTLERINYVQIAKSL